MQVKDITLQLMPAVIARAAHNADADQIVADAQALAEAYVAQFSSGFKQGGWARARGRAVELVRFVERDEFVPEGPCHAAYPGWVVRWADGQTALVSDEELERC